MPIGFRGNLGARFLRPLNAALAVAALVALPACGNGNDASGHSTVRVGLFPNVTHAPALVGIQQGLYDEALGEDVDLDARYFNAGGEAITALFAGDLDLTFIGPAPAINAFEQSNGEDVRVVGGSTSGGASLVVREGIETVDDLDAANLATPALGNTQDIALRAWLAEQGYETDPTGGGDVAVTPLRNPDILQAFQLGELDGAWVPEPWASRLVHEAGGEVLVDESELWPHGQFATTLLVARTGFLEDSPGLVADFLDGHLHALDVVADDPDVAQVTVLDAIEEISGTRLPPDVVAVAWENLEFTHDPIAASLAVSAEDAVDAGLAEPVELDPIYALGTLNGVLDARGRDEVAQP